MTRKKHVKMHEMMMIILLKKVMLKIKYIIIYHIIKELKS